MDLWNMLFKVSSRILKIARRRGVWEKRTTTLQGRLNYVINNNSSIMSYNRLTGLSPFHQELSIFYPLLSGRSCLSFQALFSSRSYLSSMFTFQTGVIYFTMLYFSSAVIYLPQQPSHLITSLVRNQMNSPQLCKEESTALQGRLKFRLKASFVLLTHVQKMHFRVRIDPPHPLVCRKRRLNGAVLRMRPKKPRSRVTAGVAR
jgi:hypothetical protein